MALQGLDFKITKGMNQDLSAENATPDSAFYLFNLKNQVIDRNGQMALTNEKGTLSIPVYQKTYSSDGTITTNQQDIQGHVIGTVQCTTVMAAVFTKDVKDRIYRIQYNENDGTIESTLLAEGYFNFGSYISGIFCYENSELQKIYWVDGVNELRYINLADINGFPGGYEGVITNPNNISTNPKFRLGHKLNVERIDGGGIFQSGVIQYCFTYFKTNGPETGIVDISPMYYIAQKDRGMRADENISCSFKISIINPNANDTDTYDFDYIRVYSIQRNSINGTPIAKKVKDIKIK